MVPIVTTLVLLPIIAWMIDVAARRRSFITDFVLIGIVAMAYIIVVRAWMTVIMGGVIDVYAMPTLIGSVVGMSILRWWAGRWYAPRRTSRQTSASTASVSGSKYAGYRRTSI